MLCITVAMHFVIEQPVKAESSSPAWALQVEDPLLYSKLSAVLKVAVCVTAHQGQGWLGAGNSYLYNLETNGTTWA